jgi:uncharacterized protein
MPVLVASEANLLDLARRMEHREHAKPVLPVKERPVDARRFRPNIMVEGPLPWSEDSWGRVTIGVAHPVTLRRVEKCGRCSVPTVDPSTMERAGVSNEPTQTLLTFHAHPKRPSLACFGSYFMLSADSEGLVMRVGDVVTLHEFDDKDQ